jgi:hypothetical protein
VKKKKRFCPKRIFSQEEIQILPRIQSLTKNRYKFFQEKIISFAKKRYEFCQEIKL